MSEEKKIKIGYMVIEDYTEDYSEWSGQIAYPDPEGANLHWQNTIKMVEASPLVKRLKEIKEHEYWYHEITEFIKELES